MRRLRQLALATLDRDAVVAELRDALGIEVGFEDPAIGSLGLHNAVLPVGDQFLEVVAPVRADTAVERFVGRRGGDAGYMVITQTDEHPAHVTAVEELGVRIVARYDAPGFTDVQLHPADTGGAFLEIDQNDPPTDWHPAGHDWRTAVRTGLVDGIVGVDIVSADPATVAERWARLLLVTLDGSGEHPRLHLDDAVLQFVPAATVGIGQPDEPHQPDPAGRPIDGIAAIDLRCVAASVPDPVAIGGVLFRFRAAHHGGGPR